ncbi:MAG: twin-arginine translocation signal domain-containing protein [Ignavibacteria bacterium]|nr:twin-arginine translocation signal domain-containing protein [Ignavibacteria bacterium]
MLLALSGQCCLHVARRKFLRALCSGTCGCGLTTPSP